MKDEEKIVKRLHELRAVMDELQVKANEQLQKRRQDMDLYLLRFLNQERLVYEFALSNLEWVLGENE
jgi:hypothetical protein